MRRNIVGVDDLVDAVALRCGGVNKVDLKRILQTTLDVIARESRHGISKIKYLGVFSHTKSGMRYTPNWEIQDRLWREWELVPNIKHNRPSQYW